MFEDFLFCVIFLFLQVNCWKKNMFLCWFLFIYIFDKLSWQKYAWNECIRMEYFAKSICFFISFFFKKSFFIILVIHVIKVFIISCFFPHDNHMIQIMRLLRYAISVAKAMRKEKGGFICELMRLFAPNFSSIILSRKLSRPNWIGCSSMLFFLFICLSLCNFTKLYWIHEHVFFYILLNLFQI